jgi:hypothetical protein
MVDLMMWLVIAALLLAAAIQGIGYYQRAAYLYQVKNDVMGGATKVLSVAGMDHNGNVDEDIVNEGLDITQTTQDVVLVADTNPDGKPLIRGTHPGIPGKEVIYLFYPYGSFKDSELYIVDPTEIPSHWDGDDDRDGAPNGSDNDIDGDDLLNTEDPDMDNDGIDNNSDQDMDGDDVPNGSDPDIDGDGILNGTDPDVDGDGTPNSSDSDADNDGTSNSTDSTPNGTNGPTYTDTTVPGFATYDYATFNEDESAYGHPHDPVSPNHFTYKDKKRGEIINMYRSTDPGTQHRVMVRAKTDGSVTSGDGAVGGTFYLLNHVDVTCMRSDNSTYTSYGVSKVNLKATYTSSPGPNEGVSIGASCEANDTPVGAFARPATEAEWRASGLNGAGSNKTVLMYASWNG